MQLEKILPMRQYRTWSNLRSSTASFLLAVSSDSSEHMVGEVIVERHFSMMCDRVVGKLRYEKIVVSLEGEGDATFWRSREWRFSIANSELSGLLVFPPFWGWLSFGKKAVFSFLNTTPAIEIEVAVPKSYGDQAIGWYKVRGEDAWREVNYIGHTCHYNNARLLSDPPSILCDAPDESKALFLFGILSMSLYPVYMINNG